MGYAVEKGRSAYEIHVYLRLRNVGSAPADVWVYAYDVEGERVVVERVALRPGEETQIGKPVPALTAVPGDIVVVEVDYGGLELRVPVQVEIARPGS